MSQRVTRRWRANWRRAVGKQNVFHDFIAAAEHLLLRIERNSGHGGADMRKAEVEKNADRYAFALFHTRR
jgi:protease II